METKEKKTLPGEGDLVVIDEELYTVVASGPLGAIAVSGTVRSKPINETTPWKRPSTRVMLQAYRMFMAVGAVGHSSDAIPERMTKAEKRLLLASARALQARATMIIEEMLEEES